jgi:hypothetical protein
MSTALVMNALFGAWLGMLIIAAGPACDHVSGPGSHRPICVPHRRPCGGRSARRGRSPRKTFAADGKSLPLVATPLSRLAAEHHVDIIVGLVLTGGGDERNAAIDFPADGGRPVFYFKRHLIPGIEHKFTPGDAGAGTSFVSVITDPPRGAVWTMYTKFGDWLAWICIFMFLAGSVGLPLAGISGRQRGPRGCAAARGGGPQHNPARAHYEDLG